MRRPPPAFNETESKILQAIYENPEATHSSYTLTEDLNPSVKLGTPDFVAPFRNTREAIENLVAHSLVHGKRSTGVDGVYFQNLKLTCKGERAAIQERKRVAEFERALPGIIKDSNAVIEEIEKSKERK